MGRKENALKSQQELKSQPNHPKQGNRLSNFFILTNRSLNLLVIWERGQLSAIIICPDFTLNSHYRQGKCTSQYQEK